jgi:hypothetical protein
LVRFARDTPWAVVFLVLLAILLAVLPLALLPESLPDSQTLLASVGSIVLLVFALFTLVRDTFSGWQMVGALLIVTLFVGTSLLIWRHLEQGRALTVTGSVRLTGADSMQNGSKATITVRAPAPRDRLLITFAATDLAPGSPCAPSSVLALSQSDGTATEVRIGVATPVELGDELLIRLKAELTTDTNCELALDVEEAVLDNG